ncbi:YggS family pyridoxal phosphate-dependent enzyme [Gaoshiqia sediminis]|uniref:Pyridoxal phosphate homeostasis protein n=1 Tax=Gaoshiqia sediminis TaxID=2986998 RepID=A0AA41Y6D4_9BACT|nr:YggS family pyridoxal phosphate-dependent enzyme [Gaoshiqia sediminis]MCW0481957.1 YggS family pyridoxal phosphate-dependent enzyme [Gaoshiqia sediminis]
MGIAENIRKIKDALKEGVCLVAVSKTKPDADLLEAYGAGQRVFGENKVQELVQKYESLPKDIEWHFIGHLQTNKVKYIAPFVGMIHGVDSLKLLKTIDKEGRKAGRKIACLLQFHIAEEETKFGLDLAEAREILTSDEFTQLEFVEIRGVMGMATYTNDTEQIRREFRQLKSIFNQLKQEFFVGRDSFSEISMGMSGDFPIAVEEGSTMVRVGSSIFGDRQYA